MSFSYFALSLAAEWTIKTLVLVGIALFLLRLARSSRPAVRHAVLKGFFLAVPVLALASVAWHIELPVLAPDSSAFSRAQASHQSVNSIVPPVSDEFRNSFPTSLARTTSASNSVTGTKSLSAGIDLTQAWQPPTYSLPNPSVAANLPASPNSLPSKGSEYSITGFVLGFIVIVGGLLAALLAFAHMRLGGYWRKGEQITVTPRLFVRRSADAWPRSALTWGALRPKVLLPQSSHSWSRNVYESVIEHESAHVERKDAAWLEFASWICITQWWNPVLWIFRHQLRKEAELATDEAVLGHGMRPSDYASALVEIAAQMAQHPSQPLVNHLSLGVSIMENKNFVSRVKRILNYRTPAGPYRRNLVMLATGVALTGAVVFGAIKAVARPYPGDPALLHSDQFTHTRTSGGPSVTVTTNKQMRDDKSEDSNAQKQIDALSKELEETAQQLKQAHEAKDAKREAELKVKVRHLTGQIITKSGDLVREQIPQALAEIKREMESNPDLKGNDDVKSMFGAGFEDSIKEMVRSSLEMAASSLNKLNLDELPDSDSALNTEDLERQAKQLSSMAMEDQQHARTLQDRPMDEAQLKRQMEKLVSLGLAAKGQSGDLKMQPIDRMQLKQQIEKLVLLGLAAKSQSADAGAKANLKPGSPDLLPDIDLTGAEMDGISTQFARELNQLIQMSEHLQSDKHSLTAKQRAELHEKLLNLLKQLDSEGDGTSDTGK